MSVNPYTNLYYTTDSLVKKFKPALTNTFDVWIGWSGGGSTNTDVNFMAYEAVLPGTSYELGTVYGDRQGRTEYYPTRRSYPPVDVSFYVDKDYKVINYFQSWIDYISENRGETGDSYVEHKYPTQYRKEVLITKFEREFHSPGKRLTTQSGTAPKKSVTYTLRNAWPSNLISIPVSYEGASILKTTVTFQYDVYNYKSDRFNNNPTGGGRVSGPGADPVETPLSSTNSDNPIRGSLLSPEEYARAYTQGFEQSFGGAENVPGRFKSDSSNDLLSTYQRQRELLDK